MASIRAGHAGLLYELSPSVSSCRNLAEMRALRTPSIGPGSLAWVETLRGLFLLDRTATETPLAGQRERPVDGLGLWRRLRPFWHEACPWNTRTEWYIDAVAGSVEGDGSAAQPINSWSEFQQRLGTGIVGPTTVHVLTNLDEVLDCGTMTYTGRWDDPFSTFLNVSGQAGATVEFTAQITAWTNPNAIANEWALLECAGVADWTPWVGARLRVLDGPAVGSVFFVATANPDALGLNVARVSQPSQLAWPYIFTPAVGNTVVLETLPSVRGLIQAPMLADGSGTSFTSLAVDAGLFPVTAFVRGEALFVDSCVIADGRLTASDYVFTTACRFGGLAFPAVSIAGYSADLVGCLLFGDNWAGCFVEAKRARFGACLFQGGVKLTGGGYTILDACGAFDAPDDGVAFVDTWGPDRSTLRLSGASLLGKGNGGWGVNVGTGGTVTNYENPPIVTGALGDGTFAGVPKTWALDLPFFDPVTATGVVTP